MEKGLIGALRWPIGSTINANAPRHARTPNARSIGKVDQYTPNMTSYEETLAKLNAFFLPKGNATYERHVLRQMKQSTGEAMDAFTVRLRIQAERCDFGDRTEENIKDQIIQGCQSPILRRDLLKRGDADLEEILRVAKIYETVQTLEKLYATTPDQKALSNEVNKIDVKQWRARNQRSETNIRLECNRCGYSGHSANDDKCPAKGKSCNKCGGRDHFERKCRKRKQSQGAANANNRKTDKDKTNTDADKDQGTVKHIVDKENEYVFNVTSNNDNSEMSAEIGGIATAVIIDSGSKYNLLSELTWANWKKANIVVSNQRKKSTRCSRLMAATNYKSWAHLQQFSSWEVLAY